MSDSDDTDILLLIPPDLFVVPSSELDDDCASTTTKPGVVSEILEHVQSLESRISAIESRDNSFEITTASNQIPSSTELLIKSPKKINRSLSVPSTPLSCVKKHTHLMQNNGLDCYNIQSSPIKANTSRSWDKHENLKSLSDPLMLKKASRHKTLHASSKKDHNLLYDMHDSITSPLSESYCHVRRSLFSSNLPRKSTENVKKKIENLNLMEVEQMLQEIEKSTQESIHNISDSRDPINQKFQDNSFLKYSKDKNSSMDKLGDILILSNDDSTQYADSDKLMSDIKLCKSKTDESNSQFKNTLEKLSMSKIQDDRIKHCYGSELGASYISNSEMKNSLTSKCPEMTSDLFGSLNNTLYKVNCSETIDSADMFSIYSKQNIEDEFKSECLKKKDNGIENADACLMKSLRLLTLADFWEHDDTKSQEELLRIKLEEEKLRREHCEHLIQELQKKLLEQQEKVAVAMRIDKKKNTFIRHFQNSWEVLKQKYHNIDSEYNNLQITLKNMREKHQSDTSNLETKISKCQGELSQALDLAAGYKEKSDTLVKEKVDLIKTHLDELEKYKTLNQQMREDNNKLSEKNDELNKMLQNVQQDLNKERMKNCEVRNEMSEIHKALDTCEEQLTILRQEKENLNLKLKEEMNRCHKFEQNNLALLAALDDVKKSEKQAKDEAGQLLEQQEKVRRELRDVYQKQLDKVVEVKQKEFQTQLDSTELSFQTELDKRQKAIAECAARKMKAVIDKYQLEIKLLEEKHKEEKHLYELQLVQVTQKTSKLEAQLNLQQTSKNQLAEQLHSVMQRQWQQALRIISGGNGDKPATLQQLNIDKFFELKNSIHNDTLLNHYTKSQQNPIRLDNYGSNGGEAQNAKTREDHAQSLITLTSNDDIPTNSKKEQNDLRGYIQMILDMQQSNDDILKSRLTDSTVTTPPIYREVPKKLYTKKELSTMSEDSVTWHPFSEASGADTSEYITVPQKLGREQKIKPPWK